MFNPDLPSPNLSLFHPPYEAFTPIGQLSHCCERGGAIVWNVFDATSQQSEFEWLANRPARLALIILLPPPSGIERTLPLGVKRQSASAWCTDENAKQPADRSVGWPEFRSRIEFPIG